MVKSYLRNDRGNREERRILACFYKAAMVLGRATDLTPANSRVNASLKAFVQAVLDCGESAGHSALLDRDDVCALRPKLLQKLSEAEFQMELFYAQPGRLASFPYHENYRELVAEEVAALEGQAIHGDIYFVGSGPLPLTAIEFTRQTGRDVICIERDAYAAALSRRVIAELGLEDKVTVREENGAALDYKHAGLVMIAALVEGKDETLRAIRDTAPDSLLGIRSAEGLRTLLYDAVNTEMVMRNGYRLSAQTRATQAVVNTTLFFAPQ